MWIVSSVTRTLLPRAPVLEVRVRAPRRRGAVIASAGSASLPVRIRGSLAISSAATFRTSFATMMLVFRREARRAAPRRSRLRRWWWHWIRGRLRVHAARPRFTAAALRRPRSRTSTLVKRVSRATRLAAVARTRRAARARRCTIILATFWVSRRCREAARAPPIVARSRGGLVLAEDALVATDPPLFALAQRTSLDLRQPIGARSTRATNSTPLQDLDVADTLSIPGLRAHFIAQRAERPVPALLLLIVEPRQEGLAAPPHIVPAPYEGAPGVLELVVADPLRRLAAESAHAMPVDDHGVQVVRLYGAGQVVQPPRTELRVEIVRRGRRRPSMKRGRRDDSGVKHARLFGRRGARRSSSSSRCRRAARSAGRRRRVRRWSGRRCHRGARGRSRLGRRGARAGAFSSLSLMVPASPIELCACEVVAPGTAVDADVAVGAGAAVSAVSMAPRVSLAWDAAFFFVFRAR